MKPRALVYCLILFIWFLPVQPTKDNPWQYEDLWGELFSNQCSIMLLVEGTDGQILKANQGAEGFYGYTVQELETMLFRELFVDYNQLAEHIGPDCFSGLHQLADGTTRSVKVQSSRSGDAGEFTFYIITDTTEEQLVNLRLFENMEASPSRGIVGLGSWQFILDEDRVLLSMAPNGFWVSRLTSKPCKTLMIILSRRIGITLASVECTYRRRYPLRYSI